MSELPKYVLVRLSHDVGNSTEIKAEYEPNPDVVLVVRCKDCKHKDVLPDVYGIGIEALYCPEIEHYVDHDFFCKYGEKVTES